MNQPDDAALLRRYIEEGSEAAFTALVRRHVDLVYGAALRRTGGDAHAAADVSQQVFITLARQARKLAAHTVLAAWLHTATRNAALNLMISAHRRKTRETAVLAQELATAGPVEPTPDWERLRPLLDEAIDELSETDRAAVVLRCLEQRPFAEIGAALRLSADAARMRTERALDKLRAALAQRGITSTATALGAVLAAQPLSSAPAGLAATLAAESLAAGGAGFLVTLMTTKIITTVVLSALVAFGAGTYVGLNHETAAPAAPNDTRQAQLIAALRKDNQQLVADMAALEAEAARGRSAKAELEAQRAVAPKAKRSLSIGGKPYELQQAILNNLKQVSAARNQYALEHGHAPASIEDLVGVKKYIRTLRTVGGEDYWELAMDPSQPLTATTPDGVSVTFDPAGTLTTKIEIPAAVLRVQELGAKVQPLAMKALEAYRKAHNGANPPNEEAMLPYFATPQEGADYVEFMEARKAANQ